MTFPIQDFNGSVKNLLNTVLQCSGVPERAITSRFIAQVSALHCSAISSLWPSYGRCWSGSVPLWREKSSRMFRQMEWLPTFFSVVFDFNCCGDQHAENLVKLAWLAPRHKIRCWPQIQRVIFWVLQKKIAYLMNSHLPTIRVQIAWQNFEWRLSRVCYTSAWGRERKCNVWVEKLAKAAQLMFGRSQQLLLPQQAGAFSPIDMVEAAVAMDRKFETAAAHYDRDKVSLPVLQPGQCVFIQCDKSKKWDWPGEIVEVRPDGQSYLIDLGSRLAIRGRAMLKPVVDERIQVQGGNSLFRICRISTASPTVAKRKKKQNDYHRVFQLR